MSNETTPTPAASGIDGKTIAIISYFSVVGWIIAFILYNSNKSQLAAFHIRQSLALILSGIACSIIFYILLFTIYFFALFVGILALGLFILWIIGLISAINGQEKPVPVIGQMAQEMFASIK